VTQSVQGKNAEDLDFDTTDIASTNIDPANLSRYFGQIDVLEINAQNSIGFLEIAFSCYRSRQIFSISRTDTMLDGKVRHVETHQLSEPPHLGWIQPDYTPFLSDDPAQIVFTSGTEGSPKAIVLSHRNLADVVTRLNDVMQLTDEVREYVGVPVTYSFGLGRARAVGAAGGKLFLPERFDPMEISRMLAAGEINAISAVPSLWRLILANPTIIGVAGEQVRWIEIGSQFMSADDKMAMKALFPKARIVQHYGLTEASRSTLLDISATKGDDLGSVGQANGSVALKIAANGAIAIRGDHVALGQLKDLGQIVSLTDADGWLTTNDRGQLRDGTLWYLGRLDDQINIGGLKIGAEALENSILKLVPWAAGHFGITAISDSARGEVILLAYEADVGDRAALIEAAAKLALARSGIKATGSLKMFGVETLPRTGTDKIRRKTLRNLWSNRANNNLDDDIGAASDLNNALSEVEARLAISWQKVIGTDKLTSENSFYDSGGDSLSSLQIGLVMEAEGWPRAVIRATFEGRPLAEVARMAENHSAQIELSSGAHKDKFDMDASLVLPDRTVRNWSISLTRGFMVLTVLLSHWGPGLFSRLGLERQAEAGLMILYRAGTPGFATVFGLGIGYFMLPGFVDNKAFVLARLRLSFRLVLVGITMLASIDLLGNGLRGETTGGLQIAQAFYGVLAYYAIVIGSAFLWLPALARSRNPIVTLILAVPLFWLVWQGSVALVPVQQNNILELPRLMIAQTQYNVFKMTMVAAAGAALGLWISNQRDTQIMANRLVLLGGVVAVLCLFSMGELNGFATLSERKNPAFSSISGQIFYVSLSAFLVGVGLKLTLNWQNLNRLTKLPIKAFIVMGGLALPVFVFHGLVRPVRDVLLLMGLPSSMALALPLTLFVVTAFYGGRRLSRMYFG
jgi:acyl-CoA synthetase (AMP-forming)/AMP-acid ligase II